MLLFFPSLLSGFCLILSTQNCLAAIIIPNSLAEICPQHCLSLDQHLTLTEVEGMMSREGVAVLLLTKAHAMVLVISVSCCATWYRQVNVLFLYLYEI